VRDADDRAAIVGNLLEGARHPFRRFGGLPGPTQVVESPSLIRRHPDEELGPRHTPLSGGEGYSCEPIVRLHETAVKPRSSVPLAPRGVARSHGVGLIAATRVGQASARRQHIAAPGSVRSDHVERAPGDEEVLAVRGPGYELAELGSHAALALAVVATASESPCLVRARATASILRYVFKEKKNINLTLVSARRFERMVPPRGSRPLRPEA
jgi:hypothetical protein